MPSLPASRTARRLLKLASLGLAGLLAGLISGCNSAQTTATATETPLSSYSGVSSTSSPDNDFYRLHHSLDARQIPALRRPPSTRRLQDDDLLEVRQLSAPTGHNRS
jgi:hypothetical protein